MGCVENAVSEVSELSATSYGGFTPNDWHHVAMISEFKTDYMALSKLTHAVRTGSIVHAFYNTIYGGSCGGKEGMALAIVGGCILLQMLYVVESAQPDGTVRLGMTLREIAGVLEVTESWVSLLHTRAMVRLQQALTGQAA